MTEDEAMNNSKKALEIVGLSSNLDNNQKLMGLE